MNDIQSKIQKTGKTLSTLLKIGAVILSIAVIAQIMLTVYIQITQSIPSKVTITAVPFVVIDTLISVGDITILLVGNMISHAILMVMLFVSSALFKDISKDYTPFSKKNISKLKTIALLMLGLAVIPPLVQIVLTPFLATTDKFISLFDEVHFILAAILYFLAQIFEYGRLLQQQSDETL